jgi:hypothetical protein
MKVGDFLNYRQLVSAGMPHPNNLHIAGSDIFYFHGERAGVYARVNIEGRSFEILGPKNGYLPKGTLLTPGQLNRTRFIAVLYGDHLTGNY